ncbi:uncharacterized protein [Dysidea avara]|uniref:uncharacterized protein n=1 Tax=Dysidea avara TaxID=196820 RepID=UPI00331CB27A
MKCDRHCSWYVLWASLLLLWTKTTTGSVYNVISDDRYYPNTTCHHCHKLQHFLLNTTKYFTSNTQLLFLPGLHHLHTDFIIQNVHNISLIGSTTNDTTPDTVIQCNSSVGIVMTNITNLIVTNITVRSCLGNEYNNVTVLIKQCANVQLRHVVIEENHNSYGIVGINILSDSLFSYISSNVLEILYNDSTVNTQNHSLSIDHYHINCVSNEFPYRVLLNLYKSVKFHILNSTFQNLGNTTAIIIRSEARSDILFEHCKFNNISASLLEIKTTGVIANEMHQSGTLQLKDCEFVNNHKKYTFYALIVIRYMLFGPDILIDSCTFHHNCYPKLLKKRSSTIAMMTQILYTITIANTKFSSNVGHNNRNLIDLWDAELKLKGPVLFYNISNVMSVIKLSRSTMVCFNNIEFVMINGYAIIQYRHFNHVLFVYENATINVIQSNFSRFTLVPNGNIMEQYPPCYFQYLSNTKLDKMYKHKSFSIKFENNTYVTSLEIAYNSLPLSHCRWLPQSAFNTAMALDVNSMFVKHINGSGVFDLPQLLVAKKSLCYCDDIHNMSYDCYKDSLHPVLAGQTLELSIYTDALEIEGFSTFDTLITAIQDIDGVLPTAITDSYEMMQIAKTRSCSTIKYFIAFPAENWCELFLKGSRDGTDKVDMYYIKELLPCPAGFVKINGTCQCYPFLMKFHINCNIDDQSIIRPTNGWISPILQNNSYNTFYLSLQCPFHYCLPYSSHLNFSTLNSQCQFNRSGILCGHCQQGLSTKFSSSHCQKCSNIYLFLIVVIIIAGLVLVLLLFILNLTVTDGTINAFILYVNIISINTPVFFPSLSSFMPAYTFISLANLDLGIQTCFYNGMDDYAKMWLQLAFPFYLIFIATSLIITSRYSTTIQRLTARRALPVLATLFLLSCTKILLTISSVLFSYSKITHLPSEHISYAWSVDANLPLLGAKFIILFLTCLFLFMILIPFNLILLFTKTLSRFQFITKFKPLLDAYQGPYKIKFYYWTGMQLLTRTVFFVVSSLDRDINLAIGMILLSILGGFHGTTQPFKNAIKNYQELLLILNLQVMYTISLYGRESAASILLNVMITMAAAQFVFIVLYHIITYMCGSVNRNKMMLNINKLIRYFNDLYSKGHDQPFELNSTVCNRIPEVTHCYQEFREY